MCAGMISDTRQMRLTAPAEPCVRLVRFSRGPTRRRTQGSPLPDEWFNDKRQVTWLAGDMHNGDGRIERKTQPVAQPLPAAHLLHDLPAVPVLLDADCVAEAEYRASRYRC